MDCVLLLEFGSRRISLYPILRKRSARSPCGHLVRSPLLYLVRFSERVHPRWLGLHPGRQLGAWLPRGQFAVDSLAASSSSSRPAPTRIQSSSSTATTASPTASAPTSSDQCRSSSSRPVLHLLVAGSGRLRIGRGRSSAQAQHPVVPAAATPSVFLLPRVFLLPASCTDGDDDGDGTATARRRRRHGDDDGDRVPDHGLGELGHTDDRDGMVATHP